MTSCTRRLYFPGWFFLLDDRETEVLVFRETEEVARFLGDCLNDVCPAFPFLVLFALFSVVADAGAISTPDADIPGCVGGSGRNPVRR